MSWADELYLIYDQQVGVEHGDGNILLPISHSTANAQIEVTLNSNGDFVTARELTKEEGKNTVIPVTEDSGGRTSGVCAMPFADKLIYLAGDYHQYTDIDNSSHFDAYITQLYDWHKSRFSHPSVNAVYAYLYNKSLINDLLVCHVLQINSETGKLDNGYKIAGIAQTDSFLRFRVQQSERPTTWTDKSLYKSFIDWYNSKLGNEQLCYATGKILPATYKHPSKIRNTGDKAKLISSNDENGFTYRGRFADKSEAISVSYEFSQKMHNALKWLIARQGLNMQFSSLQLVIWASNLEQTPDIMNALIDEDDDEYFGNSDAPDTAPIYRQRLKDYIYKRQNENEKLTLSPDKKVMILGLDAATTGRLSVSLYEELEHSRLLEQLEKWHTDTAVLRYFYKQKKHRYCSFSVREIIRYAYGTEVGKGSLECKAELMKDKVLRLIPCITQGRALPTDIVMNLTRKASNPMSYEQKYYNHSKVLEAACGMIRRFNIDREKGVTTMAYDPNEKDRSYLYGCLLAIADAAERATYEKSDEGRVTNARRYWSAFSQKPWQTWKIIEDKLRPYLDKTNQYGRRTGLRYEKMLNEIMQKFAIGEFENNTALSPNYLLGYHHYSAEIYTAKTDKKTEEE